MATELKTRQDVEVLVSGMGRAVEKYNYFLDSSVPLWLEYNSYSTKKHCCIIVYYYHDLLFATRLALPLPGAHTGLGKHISS